MPNTPPLSIIPGVNARLLGTALTEIATSGKNLRNSGADADETLLRYLSWARGGADRLADMISPGDVTTLLLTQTYWTLLTAPTGRGAVYGAIHAELDSRTNALEGAAERLRDERERWSGGFGGQVILDTSVFIEHELEFPESLAAVERSLAPQSDRFPDGVGVNFVVPMQVVDELDKAKSDRARGRARITLARINEAFATPNDAISVPGCRRDTRLRLLLDPLGHQRLPVPDDEIVTRTLHLQTLSSGAGIATFDTGMAFRARAARVESWLLDQRRDN